VQKLSRKGFIWKTWEGELNLGYTESSKDSDGNQTLNPAIMLFSISSEKVAKEVKAAEVAGGRVMIDYKQYLIRGFKYGGTGYDVVGVATKQAEN